MRGIGILSAKMFFEKFSEHLTTNLAFVKVSINLHNLSLMIQSLQLAKTLNNDPGSTLVIHVTKTI